MTRKMVLTIALALALGLSSVGGQKALAYTATATTCTNNLNDCRLVFEAAPDGSTTLGYVRNDSNSRTVRVTVACFASGFGRSERLPDQVYVLAPGERAFVGGTFSNGTRYSYSIVDVQ